ncbi:MAG: hypothetical protein H7257_14840 [Taibaiella sp.]|nr:hypothetical protein [Taibaiella sp.]
MLFTAACNTTGNNATQSREQTPTQATIANAQWLLGKWKQQTPQGTLTERWLKINDTCFTGTGAFIKGVDTLFKESIVLRQSGNELLYIPTVGNQNGGKAVTFQLTSISADKFVFENPAHDFPQKISYTLISHDSLLAQVTGTENGKQRAEDFPMQRVEQ